MVPIDIHANEKVLLKLRKHWIVLLRDTLATAVLGLLPFVLFSIIGLSIPAPFTLGALIPFGALISAVWMLVIWMALAVMWTNWYLDLWVVTDQRIVSVDQIALFNRKITTLELENIEEITVHTANALEMLLQYGTIEIETAGPENDVIMEGIPHPERIRTLILEQANLFRKLIEENQNKEQLLHTVSHEVKNYLAKDAAALAEIAESDPKHPSMIKSVANQALSETRKGVRAMMSMLDGTNGTINLDMRPFDLQKGVLALASGYEVPMQKKGIAFETKAAQSCLINGDEDKLLQLVFKNLFDNALHYTPGGAIVASLEKEGTAVRFFITDTGVGLSAEDMERLFTPGGKGENSSSINPESTGYGLAIAKQVVEAHGGRIWAHSEGKGKGSTFIVELPAA